MVIPVLVLEADAPFRRQLCEGLRRPPFRIYEAATEQEALERVVKSRIDVVLLGLRGLRNLGLRALSNIKRSRPRTEVILLTPGDSLSLSIEGMKLGAFDDLMIPFEMETLQQRIEDASAKKHGREKPLTSLVRRCQDVMVAVSFAEAGEADTAREVLEESSRGNTRKKERRTTKKPGKRQPRGVQRAKI
jgi:DNA-binding response OmpR family regulator